VHRADKLTTFTWRASRNFEILNFLEPEGAVQACLGLLYLHLYREQKTRERCEDLMFCTVGYDTMYPGREVHSLLLRTVVTYLPNREQYLHGYTAVTSRERFGTLTTVTIYGTLL